MNLQYFKTTLRKKLQEKKLTLNALSLQADLSEDTLRSIIYGKSHDIKLSTLIKIADVLNCSLDDLVNRCLYSKQEKEVINRLRALPERSTNMVHLILDLEEKTTLHKSKKGTDIISVFLPTGNMKDGMFYDSNLFKRLDISEYPTALKDITDFGLQIMSRNYEPVYYPNDILLFSHIRMPEYNDIVLYIDHAGKIYIRKYLETGLEPINDFGKNIPSNQVANYKALGVMLKIVKEFDIEQYR